MAKFTFGNFKAGVDATDLAFMERFEQKTLQLDEDVKQLPAEGASSVYIRSMYALYTAYFDALFGEGAAQKMFGGRVNLRLCDDAMFALADAIRADQAAYNNEARARLAARSGKAKKKK